MPKVFLYNGKHVGPCSQDDLNKLFQAPGIFGDAKPDIMETDFQMSFDGLSPSDQPTFVVPGGDFLYMRHAISSQVKLMITDFIERKSFNYVGVCAGAYLATEKADIFLRKSKKK